MFDMGLRYAFVWHLYTACDFFYRIKNNTTLVFPCIFSTIRIDTFDFSIAFAMFGFFRIFSLRKTLHPFHFRLFPIESARSHLQFEERKRCKHDCMHRQFQSVELILREEEEKLQTIVEVKILIQYTAYRV